MIVVALVVVVVFYLELLLELEGRLRNINQLGVVSFYFCKG